MSDLSIAAEDNFERKRIKVLDVEMAYIDEGEGDPIVFLHGNPTSSYLWRNIMPYCEGLGRILAPDLVGMGQSDENPEGSYRFVDHFKYLSAWFDAVGITQNAIIVIHDWGSGLGFHWANQHRKSVKAIAFMEAIVTSFPTWNDFPAHLHDPVGRLRSAQGEQMVLQEGFKNLNKWFKIRKRCECDANKVPMILEGLSLSLIMPYDYN